MEYVKLDGLKPKVGDYRHGGRWKGTTAGERRERLITWMRNGKRKRTWSYDPLCLTVTEAMVNRTLIPEEEQISPYQDPPSYQELQPVLSSFALVEEAVKLYGVCPDGTDGEERILLEILPNGGIKVPRKWQPYSEHTSHRELIVGDLLDT